MNDIESPEPQAQRGWNFTEQSYEVVPPPVNPVMGTPLLDAFLGLLFFFVANIGAGLIVSFTFGKLGLPVAMGSDAATPYALASIMAVQALIVFLLTWYWANRGTRTWREFLGWHFRWIDIVWGLLAVIVMRIIISIPAFFDMMPADIDKADSAIIQPGMTMMEMVVLGFGIAVVTPIVEEVLFRGYMMRSLERKFGGWPAIIISSLVFASLHIFNYLHLSIGTQIYSLFIVLMLGLSFGIVTYKTGRLGGSMVGHFINNGMVIVAFAFVQN